MCDFLSFKKISRKHILNLARQQNYLMFLSDSYVISATNKLMKLQPKGVAQIVLKMWNSVRLFWKIKAIAVTCFSYLPVNSVFK